MLHDATRLGGVPVFLPRTRKVVKWCGGDHHQAPRRRRPVASILAAPVLTVSTADAAPAHAGKHLATIKTWNAAHQQACKVSIRDGKAWKVFSRVVNGRKAEIGVGLQVLKDDKITNQWRSPLMGKGKTSKVGSVVLPARAAFTLVAFQFEGQMGDGGEVKIKKIRTC
jgi:hypothetical protein